MAMSNKDVAQKVVDRIIELIEQGRPLPWVKPWGRKPATVTIVDGYKTVTMESAGWGRKGNEYKGTNTYLPRGEYITFKQALDEHAAPNKGSRSYPVVYWNFIKKTIHHDDTGEDEQVMTRFEKRYWEAKSKGDKDGIREMARLADMMDGMAIVLRSLGYGIISGYSGTDGAYVELHKGVAK